MEIFDSTYSEPLYIPCGSPDNYLVFGRMSIYEKIAEYFVRMCGHNGYVNGFAGNGRTKETAGLSFIKDDS